MQTTRIVLETVTLDEEDIVEAIFLLMREKGYAHIKKENISIDPKNITAVIEFKNENKTE
jgi:hypothetical protein